MEQKRLSYEVYHTHQLFSRKLWSILAEINLTPQQFATLHHLQERPGATSAELARRSFVRAQTMQTITDGLQRRGLIIRRTRPGQGRALKIYITDFGETVHDRADRLVSEAEERMVSCLSEEDRETLSTLLGRIVSSLESQLILVDDQEHI